MSPIDLIPIGTLGTLRVFTYGRSYTMSGDIYWVDARHQQPQGPFITVKECLEHWTMTKDLIAEAEKTDPKKVIYVDFWSKKRLPQED